MNIKKPEDIFGVSDEDILGMQSVPAFPENDPDNKGDELQPPPDKEVDPSLSGSEDDDPNKEQPPTEEVEIVEPIQPVDIPPENRETPANGVKPVEPDKPESQPATEQEVLNQKVEAYNRIMAPLHANGKTLNLKSPEEAIQLMQMGANYTKKMQQLAPHRKVIQMLENNGLLDMDKLSYLIDLDKKNPEAIKKLVKDSGIDPIEIDIEAESKYQRGNYQVSDQEVQFISALDDIKSTPEGLETLQVINSSWDVRSKDELYRDPSLLETIKSQRISGIYAVIDAEIVRQKALGQIQADVPYLVAYHQIGDMLNKSGGFNHLAKPLPVKQPAPAKPLPNNDKAKAASPSRSTSASRVQTKVNPLSMSDEEFLKTYNINV